MMRARRMTVDALMKDFSTNEKRESCKEKTIFSESKHYTSLLVIPYAQYASCTCM